MRTAEAQRSSKKSSVPTMTRQCCYDAVGDIAAFGHSTHWTGGRHSRCRTDALEGFVAVAGGREASNIRPDGERRVHWYDFLDWQMDDIRWSLVPLQGYSNFVLLIKNRTNHDLLLKQMPTQLPQPGIMGRIVRAHSDVKVNYNYTKFEFN